MRCVERPAEYVDGLTLTAMLRAHGFNAELFDENFVRQNWFRILAYGGFRVMVPAAQLHSARALIEEYRSGALTLADHDEVIPPCPRCQQANSLSDPWPRRRLIAWFIVTAFGFSIGALQFLPNLFNEGFAWLCCSLYVLPLLIPGFGQHLLVARYRCPACNHAWKAKRDEPFSSQQARVEAADREPA